MRLFTIKIIEDRRAGEQVDARIEADFLAGGEDTATDAENKLAVVCRRLMEEVFGSLPFLSGTGTAPTMEEARAKAKIDSDIQEAGK